jgi:hypothetical protein
VYATAQQLRDEGVTSAEASDARLIALIAEATDMIDVLTGWFFEPRVKTVRLDGRGRRLLELPWPPIVLERIVVDGVSISLDEVHWVGAPVQPGFSAAHLELASGGFRRGERNVELAGTWGYTEPDGTTLGCTPLAIVRACMLLVMRTLPRLSERDALHDARSGWRVVAERTRDQSFSLSKPTNRATMTGDPEVDMILARYARPPMLGAA